MTFMFDPVQFIKADSYVKQQVDAAQLSKGDNENAFSDKLSAFLELIYDEDRDELQNLNEAAFDTIEFEEEEPKKNKIKDSGNSLEGPRIRGHVEGGLLTNEELNIIKWTAALEFNLYMMTRRQNFKSTKRTVENKKTEKKETEAEDSKFMAKMQAKMKSDRQAAEAALKKAAQKFKKRNRGG